MFSANQDHAAQRKNTVTNAESSGVFCWNIATWELREAVNATSEYFPDAVDEFSKTSLTKLQGSIVNAPMVKESPVRFECEYYTTLRLPGNPPMGSVDVVVGRVVGIHIDERVLTEGKVDLGKVMPIARCGYYEYCVVRGDAVFEMVAPGDPRLLVGLEGSARGNREMGEEGKADDEEEEGKAGLEEVERGERVNGGTCGDDSRGE